MMEINRIVETISEYSLESLNSDDSIVLAGSGGGFTLQFSDFMIRPGHGTIVSNYVLTDEGEAGDRMTAPLLFDENSKDFERIVELANEVGFFDMDLEGPTSNEIKLTGIKHPNYGLNYVVWSEGTGSDLPSGLVLLDREIRFYLASSFAHEFGR